MNQNKEIPIEEQIADVEYDIDIAKHNLWVAKTEVQARKEEVDVLLQKLARLAKQQMLQSNEQSVKSVK